MSTQEQRDYWNQQAAKYREKNREVLKERGKAYYKKRKLDPEKVASDRARNKLSQDKRHARNKKIIDEFKEAGCRRCGYNENLVALDCHHVTGDKDFSLGSAVFNRKTELITEELKKCEVLCANCHRIEHHN